MAFRFPGIVKTMHLGIVRKSFSCLNGEEELVSTYAKLSDADDSVPFFARRARDPSTYLSEAFPRHIVVATILAL